MKKYMCLLIAILLMTSVTGTVIAENDVPPSVHIDKQVYLLLEELDRKSFLAWRGDGEHILKINENTSVETQTPLAPGMLVIVQEISDVDSVIAASVREYELDGPVFQAEDDRILVWDGSYVYGIWIRLPVGHASASLQGKIVSVSIEPITGLDMYGGDKVEHGDFSEIAQAVLVKELTYIEGTIAKIEDDHITISAEEGEFRAAITPDTKCIYSCEVGRYISIHYATDESGEAIAISIMPING